MLDTAEDTGFIEPTRILPAGQAIKLADRSLCLLQLVEGEESSITLR